MPRDPTQPLGDQKALGRAIRAMREERKDLTPEALAEKAGVEMQRLERIEAGEGDADFNTVVFIVRAMGASMGKLGELHDRFLGEEQGVELPRSAPARGS